MADGRAECSNQQALSNSHHFYLHARSFNSPATHLLASFVSRLRHITRISIPFQRLVFQSCEIVRTRSLLRSHSMASSVMSSSAVAVAGPSVARNSPRKAVSNVLLSSRRASKISGVALPSLARSGFRTEAKRSLTIVATKATKEAETSLNEASAAAEDFLQGLIKAWEKSDDKPAIAGLGFAGLIGLWASFGLINAIEKLPLIPNLFEIVGILFTGWFVYRYLLFKPDREELLKLVDEAKARITGQ